MDASAAIAGIVARVAELSSEPPAVNRLRTRFGPLLNAGSGADAALPTDSASTATSTSSAVRTVGVLEPPRITRGAFSVASFTGSAATSATSTTNSSLAMPTGVWVDRIPNARGKALAPAIAAAAERNGLEPAFLAAVFWTESSYTPDVVSRTGAIGLGQLMPETAQWLGVDPWDPMQNIDGAARLYKHLLDSNHGDITLAIASYAAGPGAVKRAGGVPDQFTANYITKLLARTDYLAGRRSTAP
jgi:soluble lytic murein transglycosylase-like protein